MSEPEIQKRMQLGLVTNDAASVSEQDAQGAQEMEEWQDFDSSDDSDEAAGDAASKNNAVAADGSDYVFDKQRRSSVDLNSLSEHSHDSTTGDSKLNEWLGGNTTASANRNSSFGSGTLHRDSSSTLLGGAFATIREEDTSAMNKSTDEADEIDTVDGSDDDMGDASNS